MLDYTNMPHPNTGPYQSVLNVNPFQPRDQGQDYTNYLEMMKDTEGSRAELAGKKMDTLQGILGRIPGFTDMMSSAQDVISSALGGKLTKTHEQILNQQYAAQMQTQGIQGGAGAGVNMSLASFGRAGLQAQQNALAQVPQFMAFQQNAFMGNIANDPAVQGPSWDAWSGQQQADTRDVYESKLAQSKALHQVQQINEQFYVQEWQRQQAENRLDARHREQQAFEYDKWYETSSKGRYEQAVWRRQQDAANTRVGMRGYGGATGGGFS